MRQLMLIDQHPALARRLQISLHFEDVEVVQVRDGREALIRYCESAWDLVVIGDTWDSSNVISVLLKLRVADSTVPILTIITSNLSKDRVRMFRLGANDVLSQPYHIDELVVRIMNLLHMGTNHQANGNSIEVNELFIDTDNHLVFRQEKEIQLTPTEYELLLFLSKEAGKVQSRENILTEVWGYEFHGNTNIVDVYIRYLRIKIDKGFKNKLIKTVRGIGYMLTE
ncbi:MAG: response regulator transcription factor [Paenibacillaceae bacterium]